MKKTIALILIAITALSLCGCGKKTEFIGSDLYVTAEGIGTKNVTLSVSGDLAGYTDIVAGIPSAGVQEGPFGSVSTPVPFTAQAKSRDGEVARYKLKAVSAGSSALTLTLMKGETAARTVEVSLSISSAVKFSDAIINIRENNDIFTGFYSEDTDGEMSTMPSASSQLIRIPSESENWRVKDYDPEVLSVSEGLLEDGFLQWTLTAENEGNTVVQFVNSEDDKKLFVSVMCSYEEELLTLEIADTFSELEKEGLTEDEVIAGYSHTVAEEGENENGEETRVEREEPVLDGMFIPKAGKIYSSASGSVAEGGGNEADTVEMELELDGKYLYYTVTKAYRLDEYLDRAAGELNITSSEVFETAGRTVHYLCYESSLAVWEENENLCLLYIISTDDESAPDPAEDKKVIEDFFRE